MIIGLVLSSAPGYSETFFRNKIKFLKSEGVKVIVFADKTNTESVDYKLINGFSWEGKWHKKWLNIFIAIFRLSLSPIKATKLYQLNKLDKYSNKKNLKSIIFSAHILRFKLDWLHYGFATTALGRENLASVMGAKMAVSIRGYDIAIYPLKYPDCYQLLWQHLDKLHYISDDLLSLAIKNGFVVTTPHFKITPAIDTSLFIGKEEISFKKPLRILTVARLHWKKGLEYTLEALDLLNRQRIDFEYTIIGEGDDYERLAFASYQMGIKNRVHFVGKKPHLEVIKILQDSDIYIQYSIQEGFCNAVLEAQAMGLLCIVSDAEGLSENVLHNKTGWVVAKRKPQLLANQILNVITLSENQRKKISQTAQERVRKEFNLENQKLDFLKFYQ